MCLPVLAPVGAMLGASAASAAAVGTAATVAAIGGTALAVNNSRQQAQASKRMAESMSQNQAPAPTPLPSPAAQVMPTTIDAAQTQESNRKSKLNQLRYGLASTIKTSPLGLLSAPSTGKTKLGA